MNEKTVKDLINFLHAIITFISYHRNSSLLLCLVVHSGNTIEYIIWAMSCHFLVLFLGECVTSLCFFRYQYIASASMTPRADMKRITDSVAFLFMYESNTFRDAVSQRRRGHVELYFFQGPLLLVLSNGLVWKGLALFREVWLGVAESGK